MSTQAQKFSVEFRGHRVVGSHQDNGEQFTVFAGSNMRAADMSSLDEKTDAIRRELIASGAVSFVCQKYVFLKNVTFDDITQAGCVCYGGTMNARNAFRNEQRRAHADCF